MDTEEEVKDDPFIASSGHATFIGSYYGIFVVCLVGNS